MDAPRILLEQVETALRRLPPPRLNEVLLFIEFLEYIGGNGHDDAEDEDLWTAVQAHNAYRQAHPDEEPEEFDSPEAFLQATAEL